MANTKSKSTAEATTAGSTVLPDVLRPKTADEALKLLEENIIIEVKSIYAFDLMRYVQSKKSNFKFTCSVNKLNQGWTVIEHIT